MKAADIVLIIALSMGIGALFQHFWQAKTPATHVEIIAATQPAERHPLNHAQSIQIKGHLGNSQIDINDGQARFKHSPCKHQYCMRAGWISRSGQIAACVPNGIAIELVGGQKDVDAVTF